MIAKSEIDYKRIIHILMNRAQVLNLIGKNERSLADLNRGLMMSKRYQDKKSQADCLLQFSETYNYLSKYEEILNSAKESLLLYQEIDDKKGQAVSLNNVGYVHDSLGNYPKGLEYYTKSLKIQEEIGDRYSQAASLINIGYVQNMLGDYPKALEYWTKSLKIREEIGDRLGQAMSLNNIARTYLEQEKYEEARDYLTRAEKIAGEIGAKELLRRIYVSFGELGMAETAFSVIPAEAGIHKDLDSHFRGNDISAAIEYAEQALQLAEELKSKTGKAEALLLQARIEKAESKFKEAIAIFEELKQPFETAKAYYYYGRMLTSRIRKPECRTQENTKEAEEYLQKAREIFEKIGAKGWLKKVQAG
ncbi:tetratricopeptide repeat protein [candidate division TA06 bacterium]|uniref:Tetratricopeptide repeat protein n=1 Tax=candidate division TA06 bacterium TaxID=2250710 RepID=A0A933IBU2_UNCT6|nr:tetratricopeptide repeat protein [candidate division TA06 bacterium]